MLKASTTHQKKNLIESFLESENIDILLLAESFLKPQNQFQMKNYSVIRNDRLNQGHGGVAIAVRTALKHKLLSSLNLKHIESISIEIEVNREPLRITVAYNPRASIHFKNDLQRLIASKGEFMIFGDFNAPVVELS